MSQVKHIHMIAICGTGMGSLAGLLKEAGYHVTGSDQNIYPPMSTELEKLGIPLYQGYSPTNLYDPRSTIHDPPDLVIIGNAVSKDNPEVVEVLKQGLPYKSMPQALSEFFIQGKKSLVVAGTHGKTTTASLLAHLLLELGEDPSYLIGGIQQGEMPPYRISKGKYFVVEGDEYDTAFFDKGPKFLHYQPYYTIITSLEFDHADIYRDLEHVTESFRKLVQITNKEGSIYMCVNRYPKLDKLYDQACREKKTVFSYDIENKTDWSATNIQYFAEKTVFTIIPPLPNPLPPGERGFLITSPLPGEHNVLNTLVCFALCHELGHPPEKIAEAISHFKGVKRRQEIIGVINDIIIIDDFAHHPTAVKETIQAVKNRYPTHQIWVVFEPRSNTSIRSLFQKEYAQAFSGADEVIISDVASPQKVKDGKILDVNQLVADIGKSGTHAQHISGVDAIVEHVAKEIKTSTGRKFFAPTLILIMSNGGFGGIQEKVLKVLGHTRSS